MVPKVCQKCSSMDLNLLMNSSHENRKNKNLGSFLRFACIWIMLEKNPYQSSLGLGWDQSPCISLTEISELQPVCSALHSIDIVRHVSFSAMCDNLMRLLGKSMPNLLDRCLGFCKRKLENEFLTETMKISTLTTSRKIPTY